MKTQITYTLSALALIATTSMKILIPIVWAFKALTKSGR
jgi:hypothetical protein